MAGKPLIVAILAGMVVTMIGVVFLQKAPEGFVISSLLRIGEDDQDALEEQLRREAAQLAADKENAIDPNSISVVKSANQGEGVGVDVAVQAQGANARSAMDYLNDLLVRYARRNGKVEETVSTKLEISDAERKLTAALQEKEAAMSRIEANEKEIKQLHIREQIEAQRVAKTSPQPEAAPELPAFEAPLEPTKAPPMAQSTPKAASTSPRSNPTVDEEPAPREVSAMKAPTSRKHERKTLVAPERSAEEESHSTEAGPVSLTEEERLELTDALKFLKTERMKLINGGRRPGHPDVKHIDGEIERINSKLQPKARSASNGTARRVKFEYVTSEANEAARTTARQRRLKLEKEQAALEKRLEKASKTEKELKSRLALLVQKHAELDAAFKPVILAPAKVVTTIQPPFPVGRLVGTVLGAVIAGGLGYVLAKFAERPRALESIEEAEAVLRMPVQTIGRPMVKRRAA